MKITPIQLTAFEITEVKSLDPIRVITQDIQPGCGRIIIECYSKAWSCFFPGMGGRSMAQFFQACIPEYLCEKLHDGPPLKRQQRQYLMRIIQAVQESFAPLTASAPASPHQEP